MMVFPKISVLMPVYNGQHHLREAVESILGQTFGEFEFIIIDDGSTDETPSILGEYAKYDSRIRIIANEENCGIAASLNKGLTLAQAPLIARMDADDWSYPHRLETQEQFMRKHPKVSVLGSSVILIGGKDCYECLEDDSDIRAYMLFGNPMLHPTVIMRKEVVTAAGGYSSAYIPAEDYALWMRLAENSTLRFANVAEPLVKYRVYPEKMHSAYRLAQIEKSELICQKALCTFHIHPEVLDWASHAFLGGLRDGQGLDGERVIAWCKLLQQRNQELEIFDQGALNRVCSKLVAKRSASLLYVPEYIKANLPDWCKTIGKKILARWLFKQI